MGKTTLSKARSTFALFHKNLLNSSQWIGLIPFQVVVVAQMIENLPAMQETGVQSLGGEDHLEKGTATHASIPAWKIPQRSLAGYSPWSCDKSNMTEQLTLTLSRWWVDTLEGRAVEP